MFALMMLLWAFESNWFLFQQTAGNRLKKHLENEFYCTTFNFISEIKCDLLNVFIYEAGVVHTPTTRWYQSPCEPPYLPASSRPADTCGSGRPGRPSSSSW
uniref:PPUP9740 n=1 Tax=Poeciliopsis prolifica TaxID=188132 RepID=A0A0S7EN09_9TELE